MTATPPTPSPGVAPFDDELYAIDQRIAVLQQVANLAQATSSVATTEAAIAEKAIRDLTTAKAEILEKERLWDRTAQLQSALEERRLVADRVRLAVGPTGGLTTAKSALETALKPKVNLTPAALLTEVNDAVDLADKTWKDLDKDKQKAFQVDAVNSLNAAEKDYADKATAAELAWQAVISGARQLEEQLQRAQKQLEEATVQTALAPNPTNKVPGPGKLVDRAAAEAGVAWKDFKDTYTALSLSSKKTGPEDDGHKQLRDDWLNKAKAAKDALAVVLTRRKEWAEARHQHEQRQASRPGRTPKEKADVVDAVLKKLNP